MRYQKNLDRRNGKLRPALLMIFKRSHSEGYVLDGALFPHGKHALTSVYCATFRRQDRERILGVGCSDGLDVFKSCEWTIDRSSNQREAAREEAKETSHPLFS